MAAALHRFEQKTIATASGRLVPVHRSLIQNGGMLSPYWLTYEWFDAWPWSSADSDRALGSFAEAAFVKAVKEQLIAFPAFDLRPHESLAQQFNGRDYQVHMGNPLHVEVKADYQGGQWGTGNLFVQTHEQDHRHGGRLVHRGPP